MAKIKIYELAKELSVESKDVVRKLHKMGVDAKSHMSTISDKEAEVIRNVFADPGKNITEQSVVADGFVPRVKRIPKSVIDQQNTDGNEVTGVGQSAEHSVAQSAQPAEPAVRVAQSAASIAKDPASAPEKPAQQAPTPSSAEKQKDDKNNQAAATTGNDPVNGGQSHHDGKPEAEKTVSVPAQTASEHSTAEIAGISSTNVPAATAATANNTQPRDNQSRPQGQGYQGNRPQGQGYQGNRDGQAPRPQGQGYQGNRDGQAPRPQGQGYQGNRPQGQGYQGNRDGQAPRPQGQGYQGNRDGQAPRPQGQGYQGNRDGQAPRPQGQGYQGNRDGQAPRPQGQGYQGNRDGQAPRPQGQGYQGNRPQGQGYQGNRDGQAPRPQGQGYQGNRDGQSRPQGQGYQGNRDNQSRPQGQGYQGNRPPQSGKRNDTKPGAASVDKFTAAPEKPSTNYRPNNKKVFVKDIVFEKASAAENKRSNKPFKSNKGGKKDSRGRKEAKAIMPPVIPKKIIIGETVVLGELAKTMGKSAVEIIKKLFTMGIMATINQELDAETAILLADEFGVTVEVKADKAAEIMEDIIDEDELLSERPPVVTIMGHVDHGKTSLLDAIRHTNVISTEAGGITQHIGAYQIVINNRKITFLDTPGHEAFTAMRARGAQITDISIIVVAADDGVMPQTIEAINHSKAAGVPIIIAINKIDKPGANIDKVKQELTEHGLVSEEWGGDTVMVPVSAKAKTNLEGLLEMILLVSDVAELKANPDRQARGTVVEAKLDKNRGPVATLLVQKGTLNSGDNILAGAVFGKVRAMSDDKGNKVRSAGPSMPVEVLGFSEVPPAGEIFIAVKDEKDARLVAARQQIKKREEELHKTARVSLDDLFKQIAEGDIQELNLVVKADVQGSVEALTQSLYKLNTDEVKVNVIHSGVGGVSESDVMLATASNAIILGFNIVAPPAARAAADAEKVDIRLYRVIYDALEDIKKAMTGLLAPEYKENIVGHAEVRAVFKVPKAGMVAGSYVTHGKISRNAKIRVIRDNIVIAEDKVDSLRRFKDDAKEVQTGFECGIGLENFNDIKEGDIFEAFIMEQIHREL